MMRAQRWNLFVLLASLLLMLVQSHNQDIMTTRAKLEMSWVAPSSARAMSVRDLYQLGELVEPYLKQSIWDDYISSDETIILDVGVKVADHSTTDFNTGKELKIACFISIWYIDHEPVSDFVPRLNQILARDTTGLMTLLQDVALIQLEATDFLASASALPQNTDVLYELPSNDSARTASEKGLIAACTMLVLALIFVSSVLVWMAGGCPVLLQHLKDALNTIKSACCCRQSGEGDDEEEKDDSATTASGILGAMPSYDSADRENKMPPGFTPNRGVFRQQECDDSQILSPMSSTTDFSSSRIVPLGIASQSSLTYRSPDKNFKSDYIKK